MGFWNPAHYPSLQPVKPTLERFAIGRVELEKGFKLGTGVLAERVRSSDDQSGPRRVVGGAEAQGLVRRFDCGGPLLEDHELLGQVRVVIGTPGVDGDAAEPQCDRNFVTLSARCSCAAEASVDSRVGDCVRTDSKDAE